MTDDFPIIEYRVPVFNDNYQPLLEEILRHRPANRQIAKELGFSLARAGEIQQAWKKLKSAWY